MLNFTCDRVFDFRTSLSSLIKVTDWLPRWRFSKREHTTFLINNRLIFGWKENYGKAISSFPFFWLYFIIRIYEYDIKVKLFFLFTASAYRYEIYVKISSIMSTNCRTLSLVDLQSWITMAACLSYTLSISMTPRFTGSSYSTRSNVESMINDEAVFYHVIFFRHFHLRLFNFAAKRKSNVLL